MSAPQPDPSAGAPANCPRCRTPLAAGQDWCVNCGYAATTRVVSPGGWRWPIIVVTVIFLLGLGGVAGAFVAASGDAQHVTTTTLPAKTLPPTATAPTAPATTAPPATTATAPAATTPTTPTAATPATPTATTKTSGGAAAPAPANTATTPAPTKTK